LEILTYKHNLMHGHLCVSIFTDADKLFDICSPFGVKGMVQVTGRW